MASAAQRVHASASASARGCSLRQRPRPRLRLTRLLTRSSSTPGEASRQRFRMRSKVILALHPFDLEATVLLRSKTAIHRNGERGDGEGTLDRRDVSALNARRRARKVQSNRKGGERRLSTFAIGVIFRLAADQTFQRISLSEAQDADTITTERDAELNTPFTPCR